MESLLETAKVVPHVNQLLVHVGNTPSDLLEYCALKKVLVQAYSPIAHGAIFGIRQAEVAERYGVSIPQLYSLRSSAARSTSQDWQPGAHARQCAGGLRHLERGHGRAARSHMIGITASTPPSRLQRQVKEKTDGESDGWARHPG